MRCRIQSQPALRRSRSPRFLVGPGRSNRRGAIAVEVALIIPFLAALVLGTCEIGQVQRAQCYVSEAVCMGCVTASQPGSSNSKVSSDIKSFLTASKFTASAAVITIKVNDTAGDVANAVRNDKISVTVAIPVSAINWFGSNFFVPSNSVVTTTTVMLKQG